MLIAWGCLIGYSYTVLLLYQ